MDGVEEVRQQDDTHLHWVASIGGKRYEWDAEITEQKPDERIAWCSTSGKENAGVVTFHRLSENSSKVMLQMDFEPEGLVENLGSALHADARQVNTDLGRFKKMIENRDQETGAWRGEVQDSKSR
jgi:uncharacterized membrane protein